jgi:hypothetical protein
MPHRRDRPRIERCADCIVSFRNQGGFSTVLPGHPGSLQVKGVVEIQVAEGGAAHLKRLPMRR